MKYTLKPLKGDSFEVEMDTECTVLDLKKKVAELKPDFAVEHQKLILTGRVLTDETVLKDVQISEKSFIVVMKVSPTAPPAAAAAAPSGDAGAARPASTPSTGGAAATPAAAPAAAQGTTPAAGGNAAALGGAARPLPSAITDLRSNPRFNELARTAVANPLQVLSHMVPALRRTHPELARQIHENFEGFMRMMVEEVRGAAPAGGMPGAGQQAGGGAAGGVSPEMVAQMIQQMPPEMRNQPQFQQLAQMVAQNPQMLAQLMQMEGGPDAEMSGGDEGGAAPMSIALSEADNAAIDRLAAMGFDRTAAAQAYLACEKNEELAANFLMDGGGDEDMGQG